MCLRILNSRILGRGGGAVQDIGHGEITLLVLRVMIEFLEAVYPLHFVVNPDPFLFL